ncbi:hypothetical protein [Pantoea sp.]|uniref:hypothetical protein n=1 Tax=Pantoea sp. TaxID=69393 RepID=UPI0031DE3A11
MTKLFENESSVLFPSPANGPEISELPAANNIEQMIEQLMAQGYNAEESGEAVLRYLEQQKAAQHSATGSAMKLRTDKERAEYMRQLRSQVAPNVWIPPQMQEEYASEKRVADAQEAFKQRMIERSKSQGPMRSTQAAIEFFQNKR